MGAFSRYPYPQVRVWVHAGMGTGGPKFTHGLPVTNPKADAISSAQLSKGLRDSADTITNLLKMNEDLRTELSQSDTTWSSRMEASTETAKSKLISSDTKLKKAQKDISKLRKGFHWATQVKECAIETAKAKIIRQKSVHHLSHKGIFKEETRNLVRLLSQSGCSANCINDIISAVLNTVGLEASAADLLPE